ncbi:MAG: hypothetical protein KF726_25505 [Anaerolineae bacterium]|nr:hypothetical protein [Anaerolineae bacterium]
MYLPRRNLPLLALLAFALFVTACGVPGGSRAVKQMHSLLTSTPHAIVYPDFVTNAAADAQIAYQYAVTSPEMLETVPCYCGCKGLHHQSNLQCYIKSVGVNGQIEFDMHAAFCQVCVNITIDVMRLASEGKSKREIRAYIDAAYSGYGPSTDTIMPME